jgi:hypothetical protein
MKNLLVLALLLCACGQTNNSTVYLPPSPSPVLPTNSVQSIVSNYNQWREAQGQEDIIPGLNCALYTVPNSTTAIIGTTLNVAGVTPYIGSFQYLGNFNVPNESVSVGLPVLPAALQPVYQSWYILKCTGFVVLTSSGLTEFDTSSDDGSNLYVNGALVVANDGLHGIQLVSGTRNLEMGVASFELDYFQGAGNQALIVNMNEALLPSANLYH